MPAPQLSLTATAHIDVSLGRLGHPTTVRVPLFVKNTSSVRETITAKSVQMTSLARNDPALPWLQKLPGQFTLGPGQYRTVTVTFLVPAHQTGEHAINVQFFAVDGHAKVQQGIEVGATVLFHQRGPIVALQAVKPYGHTAPAPPASTSSGLPLDAGLGGAVLMAAAAVLIRRRVRRLARHAR
jgi:hypothetical protein